jgi:hypothetical protein
VRKRLDAVDDDARPRFGIDGGGSMAGIDDEVSEPAKVIGSTLESLVDMDMPERPTPASPDELLLHGDIDTTGGGSMGASPMRLRIDSMD